MKWTLNNLRQWLVSSSLPSLQSFSPSHCHRFGIQRPLEHRNWSVLHSFSAMIREISMIITWNYDTKEEEKVVIDLIHNAPISHLDLDTLLLHSHKVSHVIDRQQLDCRFTYIVAWSWATNMERKKKIM